MLGNSSLFQQERLGAENYLLCHRICPEELSQRST